MGFPDDNRINDNLADMKKLMAAGRENL